MSVNLKYDIYTNCGTAKKIKGITDYYIGVTKICPICNKAIIGHPALRRKDNKFSFVKLTEKEKETLIDIPDPTIEN